MDLSRELDGSTRSDRQTSFSEGSNRPQGGNAFNLFLFNLPLVGLGSFGILSRHGLAAPDPFRGKDRSDQHRPVPRDDGELSVVKEILRSGYFI